MTSDERFRQTRRITTVFKFALGQLQDIQIEHNIARDNLLQSLEDMENWLEEKHGVKLELCHLVNSANYFTDERVEFYRKRILDHGNNIKREVENE